MPRPDGPRKKIRKPLSATRPRLRLPCEPRPPPPSATRKEGKMSNTTVKPIPEGMHTLTPHLVCADAGAAIEFYKTGLGAVELGRLPGPQGKIIHAALKIGDSTLFLMDEAPEH